MGYDLLVFTQNALKKGVDYRQTQGENKFDGL
jgi:hypothetical protein